MQKTNNSFKVIALAIFCNVLWGTAFPFIKIGTSLFALREGVISDQIYFAGLRFVITGLLLFIYLFIKNKEIPKIKMENFNWILLVALFQTTLQYLFIYIGLANITSVNGSIFSSLGGFFSILISSIIYKNDRLNRRKIIGTLCGIIGVFICSYVRGEGLSIHLNGEFLLILASFFFASGVIVAKRVTKVENPFVLTSYSFFIGGLILLVIGKILGGKLSQVSTLAILDLLYLGLLSALAFSLWTYLMSFNKVSNISIFNFLIPIIGALLAAILLKENIFQIKYPISLILVSVGIILINKPSKKEL